MVTSPSEVVTVPVGFPAGFGAPDADGYPRMLVRMGGSFYSTDVESYDLWWQVPHHGSVRELLLWAEADGISGPKDRLRKLVDDRLIAEFSAESRHAFLRHYRLLPNGIGTGQDQSDGNLCTVRGHDMKVLIQTDPVTYAVWATSDGSRSLADVCVNVGVELGLDVSVVEATIAEALVPLVQVAVAFVDSIAVA